MSELRRVARGWRWGRPAARSRHDPGPRILSEAGYDNSWARGPLARTARGVVQEGILLPALRFVASPAVHGIERLEGIHPPVVVVANHASHLDTALLIEALPLAWRGRLAVGAAADYFFSGPVRSVVSSLTLGAFPVERKRASAVSARLAVRLLEEGNTLILFPEGGRSPDGWLQEMRPGAAFAAVKARRPVVPVWIAGSEHLLPKGAKRLRRGRTDLLIGDPLYPADGEDARELSERISRSLSALAQEAATDWWTALRTDPDGLRGPNASDWRRRWLRGEAPRNVRSSWD